MNKQSQMAMARYNYRTNEYDYTYGPPADYSDYIPQNAPAQSLYRLHQQMGKSPAEAAIAVLTVVVDAQQQEPTP